MIKKLISKPVLSVLILFIAAFLLYFFHVVEILFGLTRLTLTDSKIVKASPRVFCLKPVENNVELFIQRMREDNMIYQTKHGGIIIFEKNNQEYFALDYSFGTKYIFYIVRKK